MKKKQVLMIHGGNPYSDDQQYIKHLKSKVIMLEWIKSRKDWKDGLQEHLGVEYDVFRPTMPQKDNARYDLWAVIFSKLLEAVNDGVILVGHSLGAVFMVKFLSENKVDRVIDKTILLATPYSSEGINGEKLHSFERGEDSSIFTEQAGDIFMYHSTDDFLVPYSHFEQYAELLPRAIFRSFPNKNHFLVEKVDELIKDIKQN